MTGRCPVSLIGAPILFIACAAILSILLPGCSDSGASLADSVPAPGCRAFDCHQSAPLSIYPPASGEHRTHIGLSEYGPKLSCGSCHSGYDTHVLHKNGFINGYNWLLGTQTPGLVVHFGSDMDAGSTFDQGGSTCSGTGAACHNAGPSDNWYDGAGGTCGDSPSCHGGPPLNQFPPATGAHSIHRFKGYTCSTCHSDYFRNALHRNTDVNASALDPKQTAFGAVVYFQPPAGGSAAFDTGTANCTNAGCHGTKNWYSYTLASQCPVCHAYPPLSRSLPSTGRHGLHRGEGYNCLVCHSNYAAGGYANHNNGVINGSSLDPRATVFGNTVFFSPPAGGASSYNTGSGDCSTVGCHGTENWWTGGD